MPRYRLPRRILPGFALSVLRQEPRSFSRDAQAAVASLRPPVEVAGREHVPAQGPCLVACNHYSPEWFPSWWLTLAVSAAVAAQRTSLAEIEIHWVMAAAWRYPAGTWRSRLITPATWWAFRRVGRIYGFVLMPPMPPDPTEVEARARSVRQALRLARELAPAGGMMGISPEGIAVRDATPGGAAAGRGGVHCAPRARRAAGASGGSEGGRPVGFGCLSGRSLSRTSRHGARSATGPSPGR